MFRLKLISYWFKYIKTRVFRHGGIGFEMLNQKLLKAEQKKTIN